jgi:site-specific DNA recombinase
MRAIPYARVSTVKQEDKFSLRAQIDLLRDYARRKAYEIWEELTDVETAKAPGPKNFNKMIKMCWGRKDVVILVEKTDRLYRNMKDSVTVEDSGIEIHLVRENTILNPDLSTDDDRLKHDIQLAFARHFIRNLIKETKKEMRKKAELGTYPSRAPLGYLNRDKKIVRDPERWFLLRQCFFWRAEGKSLEETTRLVNQAGLRTKNGYKLTKTHIHRLMNNTFYYGNFVWDHREYTGDHEPMVSYEEWEAAQNRKPTREKRLDIAFRGVFRCSECGRAFTAIIKKGRTYYHCSQPRNCSSKYIREDRLADACLDVVRKVEIDDRMGALIRDSIFSAQGRKRDELDRRRQENERRVKEAQNKLETAWENYIEGKIAEELYQRLRGKYEAILGHCATEEARLQDANKDFMALGEVLIELCKSISDKYLIMTPKEQAGLLKELCLNLTTDGVNVYPTYKKPFDVLAERHESNRWRPQRDSNPCCRRERAVS